MKLKTQYLTLLMITAIAVSVMAITYIGVVTPIQAEGYDMSNMDIKALRSPFLEDKRTIEEHLWDILTEEYELSLQEKITALRIVACESDFQPYAIGVNKGSFDLGVWQLNTKYQDVSRACAFDVYCSTRYAMDEIYLKQGNFTAWTCN